MLGVVGAATNPVGTRPAAKLKPRPDPVFSEGEHPTMALVAPWMQDQGAKDRNSSISIPKTLLVFVS